MFKLMKTMKNVYFNHVTRLSLFDTYVGSVLSYASEVWEFHKGDAIEKIHLEYLKIMLKVRKNTSSLMVYNELGRLPLCIQRKIRIVKFWFKLLESENCIMKSIYQDMFERAEKYPCVKYNWLLNVKHLLFSLGFGEVWYSQNVTNKRLFLDIFKQRLQDCFQQDCNAFFSTSSKCVLYRYLTNKLCLQSYLLKPIAVKYIQLITRYRLSAHSLMIEKGRFTQLPKEQRLCIFCHLDVEDEYHFIFKCSMYHEYRKLYIKKYYWYKPSMYKLLQLLSTENTTELSNLGKYLQKAETLRNLSVIDK